jgi:hypothetical protein
MIFPTQNHKTATLLANRNNLIKGGITLLRMSGGREIPFAAQGGGR